MIQIDKRLIEDLIEKAASNPRLRVNYDLRTSSADSSQRMLNALLPGTEVAVHRHPNSTENVFLLCGKLVEVIFDDDGNEVERIHLDPSVGNFGCVVPKGGWHSVEVLEPSVIFEAKDGRYGEDGSETFDDFVKSREASYSAASFSNSLGGLRENVEYLIGMERQSGSMEVISPLYIARMLNVPIEEVEECLKKMSV